MPEIPEFAEQYTPAERTRIRLLIIPPVIGVAVGAKLWFFPWLAAFSATAECSDIGGVNGIVVLNYGLFVGLPLLIAAVVGLVFGIPGFKSLRSGQFPAPGSKVFSPRRILRGRLATLYGAARVLLTAACLGMAIWGCFAAGVTAKAQAKPCTAASVASMTLHPKAS
ncbi:hypothetical protein RBA41_19025 [Massilia sp. CCM 9210]|uniref:hypothetical protein n=1 Tax=Massilia scottii TaxID=3057166 RepID=UPI002796C55F|nr:hypothetical protein [Massilia sp. CCM 9210]MDQ1815399.1 hypothetical protein [Massilia sp. CCM 9210]